MTEFVPTAPHESLFRARVLSSKDIVSSKENASVLSWFKESCKKLPEMRINTTPVKESKEINNNPAFFSVANVDITTPIKSWQQAGIIQRGDTLPTMGGETISSHGSAILLTDPKGNIFITVNQEPLSPTKYRTPDGILHSKPVPGGTEIHPVVRTPLQTSGEKLKRIMKNERDGRTVDPAMTGILYGLSKEKNQSIGNILSSISFSQTMTDGNRMQSDILYGELSVTTKQAKALAELVPDGYWVSPKELDTLTVLGITNGTLNIARSVVESQHRATKKHIR